MAFTTYSTAKHLKHNPLAAVYTCITYENMVIFHETSWNSGGWKTTEAESTLLTQYQEQERHVIKECAKGDPVRVENDEGVNDLVHHSEWFPDVKNWEIEEIERMMGSIRARLGSKWSVVKTARFFRYIEHIRDTRFIRGTRWKSNNRINDLDLGVGLHTLITAANRFFGHNNWMSKVGDSKIVSYNKSNNMETEDTNKRIDCLSMETEVIIILADNTIVEKTGVGYSYNMDKEMAFKKCKKESVSDGMKKCFAGLIVLMMDYEEKVRKGYYTKYK